MTISTTASRIQYTGNGATTAFSFPYKFFTNSDLTVTITDTLTNTDVVKAITTDYTISGTLTAGIYESGGTITFLVAPLSTDRITIARELPLTQLTDYTYADSFPESAHENALDRLVVLLQQLLDKINRSLVSPISTTLSNLTLPLPVANNYLGWNAAANALENKINITGTTIPSFSGNAFKIPRINAAANDLEYRTPAQARSDIKLVNAGNPNGSITGTFDGELLYDTTNDTLYSYTGSGTVWNRIANYNEPSANTTKTANYTATIADDIIFCDATSGSFTITLYAASGNSGRRLTILKTDSSINTVTIDGNASETIGGNTTILSNSRGGGYVLVCNGTNWNIESASGGKVTLLDRTFSDVGVVDLAGFNAALFKNVQIQGFNLIPSTDDTELLLRVSIDSGATYDAGTGYSTTGNLTSSTSGVSVAALSSNAYFGILLSDTTAALGLSNVVADLGWNGVINASNLGSGNQKEFKYHFTYSPDGTNILSANGGGMRRTTSVVNGLRLLMVAGTMSGRVVITGELY